MVQRFKLGTSLRIIHLFIHKTIYNIYKSKKKREYDENLSQISFIVWHRVLRNVVSLLSSEKKREKERVG